MRSFKMETLAVLSLGLLALLPQAAAQTIPESVQQAGNTEAAIKERKNAWTVGVAGGILSGTYMTFADELAKVLDDGDNMRVLPIATYGAASNLDDLLYTKGIDIAVTQSDVFEYFRTERKTSNLANRIHYVIRLPVSELHILARRDIKSIEDLRGKKVSFGPPGSGSSLTGSIVFQRLGVQVEQVNVDNPTGLQQLRSGELAAMVRAIGKPIDFFAKIPQDANLHFLPIPFSKKFADYYTVGELSSTEYPHLMPEGAQKVDTIAVPTVLAVYNWAAGGDRHRRVERFVERLFTNWAKFQKPPRHPKWRDVNLAATVPGWNRFPIAQRELDKLDAGAAKQATTATGNLNKEFGDFLARNDGGRNAKRSPQERDALFAEFMAWREQQEARAAKNESKPEDAAQTSKKRRR